MTDGSKDDFQRHERGRAESVHIEQAIPRKQRSQYRGTAILVGLAILISIAIGIAVLIPVTMCPVLENEWTEDILWTQLDPKMDDYLLAQHEGHHKFCKLCGGTEKVPLFKKMLHRLDTSAKTRWVMVADIKIASIEDFDEAEDTCSRIEAILSVAGIPYQVPPSTHGPGLFVPEQFGEKAIRLISGDQQARKNHNLTVITTLRKGPHR